MYLSTILKYLRLRDSLLEEHIIILVWKLHEGRAFIHLVHLGDICAPHSAQNIGV